MAAIAPFPEARAQLEDYFAGRRRTFDLPLAPVGTPFQRRVWEALREIPYGETVSYGVLAARLGQPGAGRAVGLANGQNPISIVIPCHRVIGAGGALTGYGGGLERKRWLLALEGGSEPAQLRPVSDRAGGPAGRQRPRRAAGSREAPAGATPAGRLTVRRVPPPAGNSATSVPPCSSTICRLTSSHSPIQATGPFLPGAGGVAVEETSPGLDRDGRTVVGDRQPQARSPPWGGISSTSTSPPRSRRARRGRAG